MKRLLSLLLALLLLFSLTSCIDTEEDEDYDPTADMADNEPYRLTLTSNGDGTCSVTGVLINPRHKQEFDFVIPDTSPDGELVTAINWGNPFKLSDNVPRVMTLERYNAIVEEFLAAIGDQKTDPYSKGAIALRQFQALYSRYSKEAISSHSTPSQLEKILKKYPVLEYSDVAVLYEDVKPHELNALEKYIHEYVPTLSAKNELEHLKKSLKLKNLNADKIATLLEPYAIKDGYSSVWVKSLTLPSGLTEINEGAFKNFTILTSKNGMELEEYSYVVAPNEASDSALAALTLSPIQTVYSFRTEPFPRDDAFNDKQLYKVSLYSETQPVRQNIETYWHYVNGVPTPW